MARDAAGPASDAHAAWLAASFWALVAAAVALVLFGGLMSGLTLGMFSLSRMELQVLLESGTPAQQRNARRIMPLLARPHLLLVTLLLWNAAAMEALPLVLQPLMHPAAAVAVAVTAVLIFGEVIPQAVCRRHGLAVGAAAAPLVRLLRLLAAPAAMPLASALDSALGETNADEEGGDGGGGGGGDVAAPLLRRPQLRALVALHARTGRRGAPGVLSRDEATVMMGALDLAGKRVAAAMTPVSHVFSLPADATLDDAALERILGSGHSRVPVHVPGDARRFVGVALVKEMLGLHLSGRQQRGDDAAPEAPPTMRQLALRPALALRISTPLYEAIDAFQAARTHLAVVVADDAAADGAAAVPAAAPEDAEAVPPPQQQQQEPLPLPCAEGIITLEDVLEELLGEEIVDETDRFVDNLQSVRVVAPSPAPPPQQRRSTSGPRRACSASPPARRAAREDDALRQPLLPPTDTCRLGSR